MKELFKTNIKIVILIVIIVLISLIFIFTLIKPDLNKLLENMASDFYENFYYNQLEQLESNISKEEYLSRFSLVGIQINLINLEEYDNRKYKEDIKKFINSKTKKICNKHNTSATIYPYKPYDKKDYKIEINIEC